MTCSSRDRSLRSVNRRNSSSTGCTTFANLSQQGANFATSLQLPDADQPERNSLSHCSPMGCGASQQAPPGGFEAVDAGANAPEPLASQGKSGKVTRGSVIGDLPVIRRMSLRKPGPTAAPVLVQPVSESEGSFTKSAEKASYVAPVQAVPRRVSLSITTANKKQQQAGDTPSPRQLRSARAAACPFRRRRRSRAPKSPRSARPALSARRKCRRA